MGQRLEGEMLRRWRRADAVVLLFMVSCVVAGYVLSAGLAWAADEKMHSSTVLGTKYGTWGTTWDCYTCHVQRMTETNNVKLIRQTITTPTGPRPVLFDRVQAFSHNTSGVLGDDQRTYRVDASTNVCEVCHHQTMYHQYSSSKLQDKAHLQHRDFTKECLQCHSHKVGFKPPAAGSCNDCHGYPPIKPSDLFTGILGSSPPADGGAHGKHRLEEGMQCKTCHNNNQHGLLGNDIMEFGFNIYSGSWPNFSGKVTSGTISIGNDPSITWAIGAGQPNLGTTINRGPMAFGATCSVYCHGDNWSFPSGYTRTGAISWTNGPLGSCNNALCHGTTPANPPTPVIMGNVSTGAHKRHVAKQQLACTTCHDNYPNPHMVNGRVKWNLASQGPLATYKGFNAFSTKYLATTGTYGACNNVYCHSSVQNTNGTGTSSVVYQSVTWGGGILGCNGCHGSPMTTGSHTTHTTGYGNRFVCSDCHNGAGKDNEAKHADGTIDVAFSATYGGSYSQAVNVPGDGYGTCSTTYCHSDGNGATATATWGGAVTCTSCHGGDSASATPIASGKHAKHVNNAGFLGSNYGCADCHAKTVSDNATVNNRGNHVNKFKDYSGVRAGRSSTYNNAAGVCSASYCHSDGKGTQKDMSATGWNSGATLDCTGCHGSDPAPAFTSVAGEPNYANAGAGTPRANSHQRHMGGIGGTTCVYCHNLTMTSGGTIIPGSTTHTNTTRDVQAGGGRSFTFDAATKTCSNISCHGGASPAQWGQSMPADCTGCHGNNAQSANPKSEGKHPAHMNQASLLGTNYGCVTCHALTVSSDRTIADPAYHGNGFKNITGARVGGRSTYNVTTGVCSATYCHTDGKGTQKDMSAFSWRSTATLDCTGCHGSDPAPAFTSVAGEPNYATTGPGTPRANTHQQHVGPSGAVRCINCHANTVTAAGTALAAGTAHTDRNIDVVAGNGKTFTYVPGTKTCSNISCHGVGAPPQTWGGTMPADCTGCHGNNAVSPTPIATGKHAAHVNNAVFLGSNYGCADCHAKTVSADRTIASTVNHGNGFKDYSGARSGGPGSYSTATGVCSASYCHSDGKGTQKSMAVDNWNAATTANCTRCHGSDATPAFASTGGEPNYANQGAGQPRANSHEKHMGGTGPTVCAYCHGNTVTAAGAIVTASTTHTNRIIDVAPGNGKSFSFDQGTKTCSTISCHGTGAAPAQWGQLMPADCTGCHGNNSASSNPIASGKHTAHANQALVLGDNFACTECHAKTLSADRTIANPTLHGNGFKDYSGVRAGRSGSYSTATGVCSATYCHSDGKGTPKDMTLSGWNSGVVMDCTGCHGSDTVPAFTSTAGEPNYASAGGGVLRSNSHKTHAAAGASSCDTCHTATVTAAGTAIKPGSKHLDRNIDIVFNTAKANAAWNPLAKTCSNITCHGGGSATWGDAASAGCKVCHSSLSATHGKHIGDLLDSGLVSFYNYTANKSMGSVYRFGCATCHPTDVAKHRNGTVDINVAANKAGAPYLTTLNSLVTSETGGYTRGGANSFTCDTVYCHSNGRSTSLVLADYRQTPNWYGGTFAGGNRCGGCHDNPPQYAGQSHYVAASSLGNNGTAPFKDSGHMVGIHFKNNSRGNNQTGFLGYSSSGSVAHGNPAMSTTISCYICHSGVVSSSQIDTYAMSGTSSKFRCGSCHTASSRTPLQTGQIINTALHMNGRKDVVFAPVTFNTKAQLANVANALGWTRHGTYKADDSYDSFDLGTATWDPATKTCLTACHVNQPNITWGAQLKCNSCHANQ